MRMRCNFCAIFSNDIITSLYDHKMEESISQKHLKSYVEKYNKCVSFEYGHPASNFLRRA